MGNHPPPITTNQHISKPVANYRRTIQHHAFDGRYPVHNRNVIGNQRHIHNLRRMHRTGRRPQEKPPQQKLRLLYAAGNLTPRTHHHHILGQTSQHPGQVTFTPRPIVGSLDGTNLGIPMGIVQPCRRTISSIQIGAKGDVQPFDTG